MYRVMQAKCYARGAHDGAGHKRKYTHLPYWTHTEEVAQIVEQWCSGYNQCLLDDMLCAALLHDTVEDTHVKSVDILDNFGQRVGMLVCELTDQYADSSLGLRRERKEWEALRLSGISAEAQTIKYADIVSNASSVAKHDAKFAETYLVEKKLYLDAMDKGDVAARDRAYCVLVASEKLLNKGVE